MSPYILDEIKYEILKFLLSPVSFLLLFQVVPGENQFTQYGVMGLLGIVIVALIGVIWRLFSKQDQSMQARDTVLMDFVNKHRAETSLAMEKVASTVAQSHKELASTLTTGMHDLRVSTERHTRVLDKVLMTNSIFEQIERLKQKGTELSTDEIDKLVRSIIQEKSFRSE